MRERKRLFNDTPENVEINLSPLIDVVFILLIFFIVTSVFVDDPGITIQKPEALSARKLSNNAILIAINKEGQVYHAGNEIGIHGIRGLLQRILTDASQAVIIQADKQLPIDLYTKAHDQARLAGAEIIHLSTQQP